MILVPKPTAEKFLVLLGELDESSRFEKDPHVDGLRRALRYGRDSIELEPGVSRDVIQIVHDAARAIGDRPTQLQASQVMRAIDNPDETKVTQLRAFPDMLLNWLKSEIIDGWIYTRLDDDLYMPYLFTRVRYEPAREREDEPSVSLSFLCYGKNGERTTLGVTLHNSDVQHKTVADIMARKGLYHENPEFKAAFKESVERFESFVPRLYEQFTYTGKALVTERSYSAEERVVSGRRDKVILDKPDTRSTRPVSLLDFSQLFATKGSDANASVPFWPYAYCFHLSRHKHVFVNASRLAPYEYRPEVRDKLVLPDHHRDLIEVLTESGAVLAEDIIEGKKGGTIILCRGLPGTGKTSTAEAYSEIVKRPLYRVHSGQLGTSAEGIEKQLELVLDRATRWNVILLIDEAETFVATRGNSVLQNAITGVFLRVLEYWDGLLFMTTNRSDDIDDAIISRCMAVITYSMPSESERQQIWTVLAKQFEVNINEPLIEELVRGFDKASGRDIKNLLRLTKRYVEARGLSYSLDVFRQCAQFRGM